MGAIKHWTPGTIFAYYENAPQNGKKPRCLWKTLESKIIVFGLFEFFFKENILEDYFSNENIGKPSFKIYFLSNF